MPDTQERYISTVMPPGYARYAVRMGGALLGGIDVPVGQGAYVVGLVHRWLMGEKLPESVKFWPVPHA